MPPIQVNLMFVCFFSKHSQLQLQIVHCSRLQIVDVNVNKSLESTLTFKWTNTTNGYESISYELWILQYCAMSAYVCTKDTYASGLHTAQFLKNQRTSTLRHHSSIEELAICRCIVTDESHDTNVRCLHPALGAKLYQHRHINPTMLLLLLLEE